MINEQGRLVVVDDFVPDTSLPKFRKRASKQASFADSMSESMGPNVVFSGSGQLSVRGPSPPMPWYKRWFGRREPAPTVSVEDFFQSVKNSARELTVVRERAAGYEAAMDSARKAGQKALVEKLSAGLNAFRMEAQLIAIGLTKYVEEEDVVRFYKASSRGLRLDWVRNFARPIPDDVVARKVRADELEIFDNYAVLHYDPGAKSYAETQAEKEAEKARKRDPILFGLMEGRTQLYVVGDWVDERCDLTLDQLADAIGAGAVQDVDSGFGAKRGGG